MQLWIGLDSNPLKIIFLNHVFDKQTNKQQANKLSCVAKSLGGMYRGCKIPLNVPLPVRGIVTMDGNGLYARN